jgi:hypothetical protein
MGPAARVWGEAGGRLVHGAKGVEEAVEYLAGKMKQKSKEAKK